MIDGLPDLNEMTLADTAVAYLDAGLPVFPCQAGRKEPATGKGGFKKATSLKGKSAEKQAFVRSTVPEIFSRGGYNIGIPTGVTVDVLDVDVKDGKPGLRALRTLQDAGLLEGAVATAKTPSGGWHVYFPVSGEPSRALPSLGLDWKASGGYVLAAPSTLLRITESGLLLPRYEWAWSRPLSEGSCLTWQQVLDALGVKAVERVRTWVAEPDVPLSDTVAGLAGWLASQEVDRNRALYWAACRAAEAGARTRADLQPLFDTSMALQRPDDHDDRLASNGELWKTIDSALRDQS